MPMLTLAQAEDLAVRTLVRCRTSEANAPSVARALVAAEADGLKGHGLSRLPSYAAQAKAGKVDGFAVPVMSKPKPSVVAIDAAHGFAFPAIDWRSPHCAPSPATRYCRRRHPPLAPLRRRRAIRSSGWPNRASSRMMFANTPGAIAPWGGSKAVFGTNPVAFACPLPGHAPHRDRPVAVQGGARQRHDREAARRDNPGRLGARRGRQADHRSRRRACAAPCCRSATPRARRWR